MPPSGLPAEPVLVVDDDADLRETMVMLLEDEGYQVASAANGREALLYLKRCPPPCLILLDLMMPLMNGWEFRQRQRQDPALASIPVLVMSAVADSGPPVSSLGAEDCLVKPVSMDVLLDKIRRHCRRVEERSPSTAQH